MDRWDILGEIVGVEEGLFFLLVVTVRRSAFGRARVADGRIIELAQFSLSRQQTTSKIHDKQEISISRCDRSNESLEKNFYLRDLIVLRPEQLVAEHRVYLDHTASD